MNVIIENLGPIRRVEFDLSKDLNVIFGRNNIGKSYAITVLYILLKHLLAGFENGPGHFLRRINYRGIGYGFNSTPKAADELLSPIENAVKEARAAFRRDNNLLEHELSDPLAEILKDLFTSALLDQLNTSFNNSFQSVNQLINKLSKEPLLIRIETAQFALNFSVQDTEIVLNSVKLKHPVFVKKIKTNRTPITSDKRTTLYFKSSSGKEAKDGRANTDDLNAVSSTVDMLVREFGRELNTITHAIYFLPASRSGLYQALSTFGAVVAELSKSRHFVTSNFSLPSISEPVADYFLRLSNLTIDTNSLGGDVYNIAQQIEAEILGGEVGFNQQTKKLYFNQSQLDYEMDLSFTSSMISEIAPIVAYLKYILKLESYRIESSVDGFKRVPFWHLPPSLIFIEEPEAHLHPEVQVKLMSFFASLTKYNVKIVMTSHSNYMFNKLSNLLLTDKLAAEKVGSYLMQATATGSVMDLVAMRAENEGIADENFVDVAEQLYNERLQAYDKMGS